MSSEVRILVYETLSAMSTELVLTITDYLTPKWVPTLRDVFWRFGWRHFEELWRELPQRDRVVSVCTLRRAFTHQFMQTVKAYMNFPCDPTKGGEPPVFEPFIGIEELCAYEADFVPGTDCTFGSCLIASLKKREWAHAAADREQDWMNDRARFVGDREPCISSRLKDVTATQLMCYCLIYSGRRMQYDAVPQLIGALYGPHGILWMLFVLTHILKRGGRQYTDSLFDVYVWLEYATEAYLHKEKACLYSLSRYTQLMEREMAR
jgi:hypothetical protein